MPTKETPPFRIKNNINYAYFSCEIGVRGAFLPHDKSTALT